MDVQSENDESSVLECIRAWLTSRGCEFREVHHEPTFTSEESAQARGEELRVGGKALLMKVGGEFSLFVLPADRRIDSASVRSRLKTRKMRFASADELKELTGLVPGCVPPFGRPILPFNLYVDQAIRDNPRIAFNAGSLTDSIIMSTGEYFRLADPTDVFSLTSPNSE